MKKLLGILVLGLFLITPSWADDISDFEIEGISIGDSLLMYAEEKDIIENMITDYKSNLYSRFTIKTKNLKKLDKFDDVQFHFKTNDKKYIIAAMSGGIYYLNQFQECLIEKEKAIKEISTILPNIKTYNAGTSPWLKVDSSGKTITSSYYFNFASSDKFNDYIEVSCYDWNEDLPADERGSDHLKVAVNIKEFDKWLIEEAY